MGGFIPTPEQYQMVRRREEESLAKRAGRTIRGGLDAAGRNIQSNFAPLRSAGAAVGQAASEFQEGLGSAEPEPDPIMDYIRRNPEQGRKLLAGVHEPAQAIAPFAPNDGGKYVAPNDKGKYGGGIAPHGLPPARTNEPALRAQQAQQDEMDQRLGRATYEQLAQEDRRRTIRQMPDGSFTNTGTGGEAVVKGGASVGPDVGAPGRGGLSMDTSDEARRNYENNLYGGSPEQRAELEETRARQQMAEMLQKNPFAREQFLAKIRQEQEQYAIDRTYGQERAKQGAKLEALNQLDATERQALAEIEAGDVDLKTPEQKAQAIERVRQWRQSQEIALGLRDRLDSAF